MADARSDRLLALVVELEDRDRSLAEQLALAEGLLVDVGRLRSRSGELSAFLASVPPALAALDGQEAEAREEKARADAALADAEQRASALENRRRASEDERAQARRELRRAREAALDAGARLARLGRKRVELHDDERAARAEADGVAVEARTVATSLVGLARVSESGRVRPGTTLTEVSEWAARARAALLVVRGQLETERERVVAEAASLGAAVLGEELAGASVAIVRRRVEQALLS